MPNTRIFSGQDWSFSKKQNIQFRVVEKVYPPFVDWLKNLSGVKEDRKKLIFDAVGGLLLDAIDRTLKLKGSPSKISGSRQH